MKKYFKQTGIYILTAGIIAVTGCSKESNPAAPIDTPEAYIWVHFEGDSVKVEFDDAASFDVNTLAKAGADENAAIWLKDFIDTSSVGIPTYIDKDENQYETRNLYAYRITGEDGFSASTKGYPDNIWEHMSLGYMFYETRNVIFPKTLIDLAGAYNVKASRNIYINRKIDVIASDTTAFYRLCDFTAVRVDIGGGELRVDADVGRLRLRVGVEGAEFLVIAPQVHGIGGAAGEGELFRCHDAAEGGGDELGARGIVLRHEGLGDLDAGRGLGQ